MKFTELRPPITTPDGLLQVPLAHSERTALIAPNDYRRVLEAGYSPNWMQHPDGTIKTWKSGRKSGTRTSIARVIMGVAETVTGIATQNRALIIKHRNGDKTDLRRENLTVTTRNAKMTAWGRDDRRGREAQP
ncbi:hypothetical protein FHS82_002311 [Pseudochelatococcus lubricantis]|uniref:HNH endonuclease n=1 Tax=Pseudochelatococcus lubricantis TaxID=1538102 RepID=A0ABX0UZY0_9HYPH|nr:HNH endonuclease [Pseudochelatococcus lubricantis]NIJ58463.1 hypothetical protein [Pseudochelatococcus lubricantis]